MKEKTKGDAVSARAVAASPRGEHLIIGFKDGSLAILNMDKWEITQQIKDSTGCISDIKFTPDGQHIAVASHDTLIQVYEFPSMAKKATLKGHSSIVKHLDWATNSTAIRSESGEAELLFWNAETGEEVKTGAIDYRAEAWATSNCTIGWGVQGMWRQGVRSSACDRSSMAMNCLVGVAEYQLLAAGDDFGILRLYRYPCISKDAKAITQQVHASQITNVKFGIETKYVFTTGGEDRSVCQWKFK